MLAGWAIRSWCQRRRTGHHPGDCRYLAHRMRNLAVKVPADQWLEFKARVTACYQAPSRAIARDLRIGIMADHADSLPTAVKRFDDDFEACIAHLRLPITHRRSAPNLIERLFVRRETAAAEDRAECFRREAVLKLMFGALIRAAESWRGLRFTEFELRQLDAVRKDLDAEYEASITRSDRPYRSRFSSKSAP